MNRFEKYLTLKKEYEGVADGELKQYLHISQVMEQEERSYSNHKKKMNDWLSNIENDMRRKANEKKCERANNESIEFV